MATPQARRFSEKKRRRRIEGTGAMLVAPTWLTLADKQPVAPGADKQIGAPDIFSLCFSANASATWPSTFSRSSGEAPRGVT